MYIPNLKIALDDDSATYFDIQTTYSMLADLAVPWATPKTSALSVMGINGIADLTESFGAVFYNNRKLGLRLTVKNDAVLPAESIVNSFAQLYDGQRVRIKVIATNDYFFVGRLTITADDEKEKLRQITCAIDADPLRYDTSYTPSASGLDITPENLGTNLWSAANVSPVDTGMTVTASGGTIAANAPISIGEGHMFTVDTAVTGSGKLLRFYFSSLVNCEIELRNSDKVIGKGTGTILILTDDGQCSVNVFRKDETAAASFACTIREITTHTVNNAGKAVPFAVNHYYSAGIDQIPKMYVNGTVFSLGELSNVDKWEDFAPAVLKSGNNTVASFIDYGAFDASGADGTIKIRYRKGVL